VQKGIKDTLRAYDYFLPCVCAPTGDIEATPPEDTALDGRAVVAEIHRLSENRRRL